MSRGSFRTTNDHWNFSTMLARMNIFKQLPLFGLVKYQQDMITIHDQLPQRDAYLNENLRKISGDNFLKPAVLFPLYT